MFKTMLVFIKAHTIATAITATVVVSTVVATPIIINQVQKPEQKIETGQVQDNIIDNTVINDTIENEIPDENVIEENIITTESNQVVDENKQENNKPSTDKSNTTTTANTNNESNNKPTQQQTKPQNQGTWKVVIQPQLSFCGFEYNSTTQKYRVIGTPSEFSKSQAMNQADVKAIIKECNYQIENSQKEINSIKARYDGYRADAQKRIDSKQNDIDTYKANVEENRKAGYVIDEETVSKTLYEYNIYLQQAIDYKNSFNAGEIRECEIYNNSIKTHQKILNQILSEFQ